MKNVNDEFRVELNALLSSRLPVNENNVHQLTPFKQFFFDFHFFQQNLTRNKRRISSPLTNKNNKKWIGIVSAILLFVLVLVFLIVTAPCMFDLQLADDSPSLLRECWFRKEPKIEEISTKPLTFSPPPSPFPSPTPLPVPVTTTFTTSSHPSSSSSSSSPSPSSLFTTLTTTTSVLPQKPSSSTTTVTTIMETLLPLPKSSSSLASLISWSSTSSTLSSSSSSSSSSFQPPSPSPSTVEITTTTTETTSASVARTTTTTTTTKNVNFNYFGESEWFSDEQKRGQCPGKSIVTGIQCQDSRWYCDTKKLKCSGSVDLEMSSSYSIKETDSKSGAICAEGYAITAMQCLTAYCSAVEATCSKANLSRHLCLHSHHQLSSSNNNVTFDPHWYLVGFDCPNSNCQNLSFYICRM